MEDSRIAVSPCDLRNLEEWSLHLNMCLVRVFRIACDIGGVRKPRPHVLYLRIAKKRSTPASGMQLMIEVFVQGSHLGAIVRPRMLIIIADLVSCSWNHMWWHVSIRVLTRHSAVRSNGHDYLRREQVSQIEYRSVLGSIPHCV